MRRSIHTYVRDGWEGEGGGERGGKVSAEGELA